MDSFLILGLGYTAQLFFSARTLLQWILSEKAGRVLSPSIFWILSIAGSYLFCIYGWLRCDFAIILGQFLSYYVYLWNLKIKKIWLVIPKFFQWILLSTPISALLFVIIQCQEQVQNLFNNEEIPFWLIIYGTLGQLLFTFRFLYQYFYSVKRNISLLPKGFWIISICGSLCILIYGFFRLDPVLIVGQSVGMIAYTRNIYLLNIGKSMAKLKI